MWFLATPTCGRCSACSCCLRQLVRLAVRRLVGVACSKCWRSQRAVVSGLLSLLLALEGDIVSVRPQATAAGRYTSWAGAAGSSLGPRQVMQPGAPGWLPPP
ncbi:hypothetical protein ACPA9J_07190 [Pseudomonas aeruginosa]